MSGILSILREAVAIFLPNQVPQRSLFWNCVIIAFVISAVILWVIEHTKKNKLEKELDRSRPKLSAEIGLTVTAPAGANNESSLVIIMVTIKNTGAPSIASDFYLSVKSNDNEAMGVFFPMSKGDVRLKSTDGQEIFFNHPDDNLPLKSGSQPIVTGGAVNGFCAVLIPNITHGEITSKGILVLKFKDVFGKDYVNEYDMAGVKPIKFIDPNEIQKQD